MAFIHSPKVVTDGLVLALDAGNVKSYASGSTTWFDKSGNINNGTLTNGPTYSSTNGGSIVFDGVDDFVNCGNNLSVTQASNTQFTVNIWVKKSASNKDMSIGTYNDSILTGWFLQWFTNNTIYFGISPGSTKYNSTVLNWQNQWYNLVGVFDGSLTTDQNKGRIYVNSIISNVSNNGGMVTSVPANTLNLTIGGLTNYNSYSGGNIAIAQIYNRALSPQEVLQNYNATKGRFGL
jgi:hypothetical protein